jgi:hypothetical protein
MKSHSVSIVSRPPSARKRAPEGPSSHSDGPSSNVSRASPLKETRSPIPFPSILCARPEDGVERESPAAPAFFPDLNLDQIIDGITAAKAEYNLKPFFYAPLKDLDGIRYRHEVFRDLEDASLFRRIKDFASKLRNMREHLATSAKLHYHKQKQSLFLDAVQIYCDAVNGLAQDLDLCEPESRGFLAFREYLAGYAKSDSFTSLQAQTEQLKTELAGVKYALLIKGDLIRVRKYDSEPDYSVEVEQCFEKFKQGAVKDYRVEFINALDMNHIEAAVLDFVAKLYPEVFASLERFCEKNINYLDRTIGAFDREVQFYVAYLEYISILKAKACDSAIHKFRTPARRSAIMTDSTSLSPISWPAKTAPWCATTFTCKTRNASSWSPARTRAARRHSPAPSVNCTISRI